MHAWAEVCHLSQSSKSALTDFLCSIGWRIIDQAFFKHSPHINCISNSAILHNNYISLLTDLCTYIHVKKKWHRKGSHSSWVSSLNRFVRLQTWEKVMGWCTAQWKICCFVRVHERVMQIWTSATGCVVRHENTWRWMVGCYNGL